METLIMLSLILVAVAVLVLDRRYPEVVDLIVKLSNEGFAKLRAWARSLG